MFVDHPILGCGRIPGNPYKAKADAEVPVYIQNCKPIHYLQKAKYLVVKPRAILSSRMLWVWLFTHSTTSLDDVLTGSPSRVALMMFMAA